MRFPRYRYFRVLAGDTIGWTDIGQGNIGKNQDISVRTGDPEDSGRRGEDICMQIHSYFNKAIAISRVLSLSKM